MRRSVPGVLLFPLLLPLSALSQNPADPSANHQQFVQRLVAAAIERTHHIVRYDPAYVRIPYPNGDVPPETGVCTDEIIRAYRAVGIDLQKEVHEDMVRNFSAYPNQRRWLLAHTDSIYTHTFFTIFNTLFWRTVSPTTADILLQENYP